MLVVLKLYKRKDNGGNQNQINFLDKILIYIWCKMKKLLRTEHSYYQAIL